MLLLLCAGGDAQLALCPTPTSTSTATATARDHSQWDTCQRGAR